MKTDRLVPGTILVCIGAIFLLHNFHVVQFQWMNILYLWPIFLIIGGVNLVFAGNRSPLATVVKLAVIIGGFSLLLFGNFGNRYHFWPSTFINFDDNDGDDNNNNDNDSDSTSTDQGVTKIEGSSTFNKDYTPDAKFARLNISGGATTYTLNDTTSQLFKAETKEFYGKYEFNANKEDSVYVLNLKMKNNNKGWHFDSDDNKSNTVDVKLNLNPIWDIYVETGATKLDFDLSKFKIKSVTLKGGAASFDVKLGMPLASTNVEIATGMSQSTINVPKEAACSIEANTGLSSNKFEGFTKTNDNTYETEGFSSAKNKIIIHISGALADFKVNRY